MKTDSQSTTEKRLPTLSESLGRWLKNIAIPFIKERHRIENGPIEPVDDNPKDQVDRATVSQVSGDSLNKENKLNLLIALANQYSIFTPQEEKLGADIESMVTVECEGQEKTIFITDGDLSYIKGFLTGEKIEFCSTATELGKAILGKEIGKPFTVTFKTIGIGKKETTREMKYTLLGIFSHKASMKKLFDALPVNVPQTT